MVIKKANSFIEWASSTRPIAKFILLVLFIPFYCVYRAIDWLFNGTWRCVDCKEYFNYRDKKHTIYLMVMDGGEHRCESCEIKRVSKQQLRRIRVGF